MIFLEPATINGTMKIIGHRGVGGTKRENTIEAITEAIRSGVDAVEVDVRVTADGAVLLHHDPYVSDETGRVFTIEQTTYQALRTIKPDITTLSQAMDIVQDSCELIVEIKSRVKLTEVISASRVKIAAGFPEKNLFFASFDQAILRRMHENFPNIRCIVNEVWSSSRARKRARALGTTHIALLEYWVWPGLLRTMQRSGYQTYVYPATNDQKKARFRHAGLRGCTENPERARKWSEHGLTGVMTDRPDLFR